MSDKVSYHVQQTADVVHTAATNTLFGAAMPDGYASQIMVTATLSSGLVLTGRPLFTTTGDTDIDPITNFITKVAHGLVNGMTLSVASSATLPTGLTAGVAYFVVQATADTFKVSLTLGGAEVDITADGTAGSTLTWSNAASFGNQTLGTVIPFRCRMATFAAGGCNALA